MVASLNLLEIEDLSVEVDGKRILEGVNLEIPEGESHVLFGPNGSGKTSILMTILGFPDYKVVSGRIRFDGIDITNMSIDERVKLGMGIAFQRPPAIRGVKLGDMIHNFLKSDAEAIKKEVELCDALNFEKEFLSRDLNLGFSGGEVKKSEILQVLAQKPKFAMLDEPDSGVDIENLSIIGKVINNFLKESSGLLITHVGYILRYVEVDKSHVLIKGEIACSGEPIKILDQILKEGYGWCEKCLQINKSWCKNVDRQRKSIKG
ncbi:MAG: Fe-S cluster assembly ATPase SufC [Candidatus Methylarchaceae archaeon HK01B]|nr:Fe-S cluster assembly ATPase SufC [Candidatus Methylarchaceae archaeon HK01B]